MPSFITYGTPYENSSSYILQDSNNFLISLTASTEQLLTNLLIEGNSQTVISIDNTQIGGIKQLVNSSLFTDNGIADISRQFNLTKLLLLSSPSGYVPVRWGLSNQNLNKNEYPTNYSDVTIIQTNNTFVNSFVILFAVDQNNNLKNIYKMYKIKNKTNFNADRLIENNFLNNISNKVVCDINNFTNVDCSQAYLTNQLHTGKLNYTIYERLENNITFADLSKPISNGYIDTKTLFNGGNSLFPDINNSTKNIIVIEGNLAMPYDSKYTFQFKHSVGIDMLYGTYKIYSNFNSSPNFTNATQVKMGTPSVKIKIKLIANNTNVNMAMKYSTEQMPTFEDVNHSWFSTKYYINTSDGLNEIYSKQKSYCANNLNQPWCKDLTSVNKYMNDDLYDNYCITNKKYLSDYNFCKSNYSESNNKFTKDVISYCTDTNRLFNSNCLNNGVVEPAYLATNIWDSRIKYCDVDKFKTDVNCQNTIKSNTHLFDKLLADNCNPGDTNISCIAGLNAFTTNARSVPYYAQQMYNKCIKSDGKLDADNKLCIDTALDPNLPYSSMLIQPMIEYCKDNNNITNTNCEKLLSNQKCKSGFTNNTMLSCEETNYDYTHIIILLFVFIIAISIIKLNFKIDNIYTNSSKYTNYEDF